MTEKPREGTEAYYVEKAVEQRKKNAKDKGLDTLFSNIYHDVIRIIPAWMENQHNRKYVHPEIIKAKSYKKDRLEITEFTLPDKEYRITLEHNFGYINGDEYNNLELYDKDEKIFSISELINDDEYCTFYLPVSVNAYTSDDWVEDFKKINEYQKKISHEFAISQAEDPEKIELLKKNFGIKSLSKTGEFIELHNKEQKNTHNQLSSGKKSYFWAWVIVVILLISIFYL